ncbi:MAG: serine/threonine protein kinase [Rubrivivax sp.]|nr:serine/threonine protein kinase [Rubrivivax sp.]
MTASSRIPPALWPAVSALFDDAQAQPPDALPAWLAALDRSQPDLAPHLRRLLAAGAANAALPGTDAELMARALAQALPAAHTPQAGDRIGAYRLLAPIGRGGMATVWVAEQLQGVLRQVALKLPDAALEPAPALAMRFTRERDLLAALEHPHIGRLYDAGIADGQPFLALELITGRPITLHAAELPLRQRLPLFQQVLAAVAFAHARLVIHRDLKPNNILVTPDGQVKLLDFGIARLLSDEAAGSGPGSGAALTPDCASPEQLAGAPLGVASDVYSLGVVLYELVCGRRPYVLDRASALPLAEQLARVELLPPGAGADLDAIVACAMARDPAARYASVDALAADLQRLLEQRPVQARPGGRRYRLGLALRRHRGAVFAAGSVAVALVLGSGVALWQAQAAWQQAARAEAAQRLLVNLFDGVSPEQLKGGDISARDLVLQGSHRIDAGLQDQPRLQADLRRLSGELLGRLQAWQAAAQQLQGALDLYDRLGLTDHPDALAARALRLEALNNEHQSDAARAEGQRLLALADARHGPLHRWSTHARLVMAMATLDAGQPQTALDEVAAALALPPVPGVDRARQQLVGEMTRGQALWDLGRLAESRAAFETVLAQAPAVPGFPQGDVLQARYRRLAAIGREGDFGTVVADSPALLADSLRFFGPSAITTLHVQELRAQALARVGRYAEAVAEQRAVVQQVQLRAAADDERRQAAQGMLGILLVAAGQVAEGLPQIVAQVDFLDRKYPVAQPYRETLRLALGMALLRADRATEALPVLRQALAHVQSLPAPANGPLLAEIGQALALAEHAAGQSAAARQRIGPVCTAFETSFGPANPRAQRCHAHQAWLRGLGGDPTALADLDRHGATYQATLPEGHVVAAELQWMRAELLAAARQPGAPAELAAARADWTATMGVPAPRRFSGLH